MVLAVRRMYATSLAPNPSLTPRSVSQFARVQCVRFDTTLNTIAAVSRDETVHRICRLFTYHHNNVFAFSCVTTDNTNNRLRDCGRCDGRDFVHSRRSGLFHGQGQGRELFCRRSLASALARGRDLGRAIRGLERAPGERRSRVQVPVLGWSLYVSYHIIS